MRVIVNWGKLICRTEKVKRVTANWQSRIGHRIKSPSRGEFSTKGQARVRTRSVKVQKAQLSFIFIWLAADLSILFSSLKIAPKITRQKLISDNPTSSEWKKLCKSMFWKNVGRLLTFRHFSQVTLSHQTEEEQGKKVCKTTGFRSLPMQSSQIF